MEDPVFIPKEIQFAEISDFVFLKKKGIEWVQQLSGDIWTDHNTHDPGITILEQLCYALTELGVKSQIDIEQLLFSGSLAASLKDKFPLYSAANIFPVSPVNANDYRKLLIDACYPEVRNAWAIPKQQSTLGLNVQGLYRIVILPEEQGNTEALVGKVRQLIHAHRNLGEDFDEIIVLEPLPLTLITELLLEPNAVGESVQANILFALKETFTPRVRMEPYDVIFEQGGSPEHIFDGPPGKQGYISNEDLERTRLSKIQTFFKAQLIKIISQVEGVREVKEFRVFMDGQELKGEQLSLPEGRFAVLDTLKSRFLLRFGNIVYTPEAQTTDYLYKSLESREMQLPGHGNDPTEVELRSTLRENDITRYFSVQDTFPENYGIGKFGLPINSTPERKAQAQQLQGYLYPFEQILASFLTQLLHARLLFTMDDRIDKTYFNQVPPVENLANLIQLGPDQLLQQLDRISNAIDKPLKRRIAFLDFLLAWFGEEPIPESMVAINRQTAYHDQDSFYQSLIRTKVKLLRSYVELSRGRGLSFNYLSDPFDKENVPGLKKKVSLLFNIEEYGYRMLSAIGKDQNMQVKAGKKSEGGKGPEKNEFQFKSPDKDLIEELLLYVPDRYNFSVEKKEGQFALWYTNPRRHDRQLVYAADSARACEEALLKLQEYLRNVNRSSESFHLVEHILLRPVAEIGYIAYLSDGKQLLLSSSTPMADPEECRTTFIKNLEELSKGAFSLVAEKDLDGFSIIVKDAKGKAVAYQTGFTQERTAQKALKNVQQIIREKAKVLAQMVKISESTKEGLYFSEDPYSNLLSFIMPNWTARFQNRDFQKLFEQVVKVNTPACLAVQFLWLDIPEMQRFESSYQAWLDAKRHPKTPAATVDTLSLELHSLLRELNAKYVLPT